jgi:DNA polymerase-3 subunit gamma/tau
MYQVIARKYRPQSFSELIGQEPVRVTLENAIAQRRIAHGYILAGQRGTGKTTVARIMARCLNCIEGPTPTPCGKCASCIEVTQGNSIDVIEIDAASNRGINEMRELRENVRFRPARDRYKVFIVDEAHQITSEAFNALLKTLEEPPEWVVFILCTTEAHKIPTTIASRCQQFSFRSVGFDELTGLLERIAKQEGVTADAGALAVLAQVGEGSVRDSLSALDQAIACCGSALAAAEVRDLMGLFSLDTMGEVTAALEAGDSRKMLEIVQEIERNGRNLQHFTRELARYFRNLLVARITGPSTRLIAAPQAEQEKLAAVAQRFGEEDLTRYLKLTLETFQELQYSLQPRLHIEVGLLRLIHAGRLKEVEEALSKLGPAPAPRSPVTPPSAPPETPKSAGPFQARLAAQLTANGLKLTAAAIEASEVEESATGVRVTGPRELRFSLNAADLQTAVNQVLGRPVKVTVEFVERAAAPPAKLAAEAGGDAAERALSHPDVKRFRELFPESEVKKVEDLRNL